MTIFRSLRAYLVAFSAYLVAAWMMIRAFERRAERPAGHPELVNLIAALFCCAFFGFLLTRTANLLERAALAVSSLYFLVWAFQTVSDLGLQWARISHSIAIFLPLSVLDPTTVGIRALQVMYENSVRPT